MAGILLIDDAKITRNMFRNILERTGYTVCGEASNGKEGIEQFRRLKPDLVFCDIMMREMTGLEFLGTIMSENPEAKVVICTSAGDKHHIAEACGLGAKDFIIKPIKANDVIRITENLIGKAVPAWGASYKHLMEARAVAAGIDNKCLLDFFEAFLRINNFGMDDARVDRQFLMNNLDSLSISIRALISAKMTTVQVEQLIAIFKNLIF